MKFIGIIGCLSFSFFACGIHDETKSDLKVIDGSITGSYPGVISFLSATGTDAQQCSGTLIRSNTVLTAAHCVTGVDESQIGIRGRPGIRPHSIIIHPSYDGSNRNDIALMIFSQSIDFSTYSIYSGDFTSINRNVTTTLVGYGHWDYNGNAPSSQSSSGTKRMGTNVFNPYGTNLNSLGYIRFIGKARDEGGTGNDVAPGRGDSGGPLFYNGQIVGVASSNKFVFSAPGYPNGGIVGNYSDVTNWENKSFIQENL